jgi:hypothetical protein
MPIYVAQCDVDGWAATAETREERDAALDAHSAETGHGDVSAIDPVEDPLPPPTVQPLEPKGP